MTSIEILEALIQHYGSQAEVAQQIGRSRKTPLRKKGQIASQAIESDLLTLWQSLMPSDEAEISPTESAPLSSPVHALMPVGWSPASHASVKLGSRILYQRPYCPYATLVKWTMARKHLDYLCVRVDKGSLLDQKLQQSELSLPLLFDAQSPFSESQPILAHLDQTYADESVTSIKEKCLAGILSRL
jgi:glutaredoxin